MSTEQPGAMVWRKYPDETPNDGARCLVRYLKNSTTVLTVTFFCGGNSPWIGLEYTEPVITHFAEITEPTS